MDDKLHYRLFAKLLMFVTLLLGGFIGYVAGMAIGQQQTLALIQEGRQIEQTTATAVTNQTSISSLSTKQLNCYKAVLGGDQYLRYVAGGSLTTEQSGRVATCSSTSSSSTPTASASPTVTISAPAQ